MIVSGFVIVVAAVRVGVVACPVFMGISREFSRGGWDAGLEIRVLVRSETNRLTCCRLKGCQNARRHDGTSDGRIKTASTQATPK